ncbi:hypothetical protein ACQB60_44455, partial [Actinomycetota bacterium Odt1-20B]
NLAPELREREDQGEGTRTGAAEQAAPARRSPEAARATMASLRSGRRRAHAVRDESRPPHPSPNDEGTR